MYQPTFTMYFRALACPNSRRYFHGVGLTPRCRFCGQVRASAQPQQGPSDRPDMGLLRAPHCLELPTRRFTFTPITLSIGPCLTSSRSRSEITEPAYTKAHNTSSSALHSALQLAQESLRIDRTLICATSDRCD